jgi:hypothetical protein
MENLSEKHGEPRQFTPVEWFEEFNKRSLKVKQAADDWAVRWNEPEGKFISALLSATSMQGEMLASWQETMNAFTATNREIVQAELNILHDSLTGAKYVLQQGEVAIRQARQVQHGVAVDREHMATQMIEKTLPLFADKLKHALVIRERTWNGKVRDRRWAMAAAVSLTVFLLGYSLSWWQDSGTLNAFDRCLKDPLHAGGQYYCPFDANLLPWYYQPAVRAQNTGG